MPVFRSLASLGFPDYAVTSDGRVFSRRVYGSRKRRIGSWWEMKPTVPKKAKRPVPFIRLFGSEVGKPASFSIHQVVAHAWIGPNPGGKLVCHKDDNQLNNHASNLYYGDGKTNWQDAIRNGAAVHGELRPNATLTNFQVSEIKRRFKQGERQYLLAKEFGITLQKIYGILRGWTWKHVK